MIAMPREGTSLPKEEGGEWKGTRNNLWNLQISSVYFHTKREGGDTNALPGLSKKNNNLAVLGGFFGLERLR